jgi:hypothetical protein
VRLGHGQPRPKAGHAAAIPHRRFKQRVHDRQGAASIPQ